MRIIYFVILAFLGTSYNFTYSMERHSLFHNTESVRSSSSCVAKPSFDKVEPKFTQEQNKETSKTSDRISSFDRKKLTPKSPFSIGYGINGEEETISDNLGRFQDAPIVIPTREGVVMITANGFMKYVPNICSLCNALLDINNKLKANGIENLPRVSQLRFSYGSQHSVVAYGFNDILEEKIELKRAGKSTPLLIQFVPYKNYEQYCAALLKYINTQSET